MTNVEAARYRMDCRFVPNKTRRLRALLKLVLIILAIFCFCLAFDPPTVDGSASAQIGGR